MQINKIKKDMTEILSDVFDGATIMVGGFGEAGSPIELLHGLSDNGARDLTIIATGSEVEIALETSDLLLKDNINYLKILKLIYENDV